MTSIPTPQETIAKLQVGCARGCQVLPGRHHQDRRGLD